MPALGEVPMRDTQRKWVAKFMVALVDGREVEIDKEAQECNRRATYQEKSSAAALSLMDLAVIGSASSGASASPSTYGEKHFSLKEMRKLAMEPDEGIPPIPPKLP